MAVSVTGINYLWWRVIPDFIMEWLRSLVIFVWLSLIRKGLVVAIPNPKTMTQFIKKLWCGE